ncbi:MAG: hypothetical protein GY793_11770 [Proteobacteria bacterium]|nr:hypothetical protein [Pseudomonadota bacterium]
MNFDKAMISKLGVIKNVDKAIQEALEYAEALRDFKILYYSGDVHSDNMKTVVENIAGESNDLRIMIRRTDSIFNFSKEENLFRYKEAVNKTIEKFLK